MRWYRCSGSCLLVKKLSLLHFSSSVKSSNIFECDGTEKNVRHKNKPDLKSFNKLDFE